LDEDGILEEGEIFVQLTCPEIGDGLAGHVPTWAKTSKASVAPKVRLPIICQKYGNVCFGDLLNKLEACGCKNETQRKDL
jgi:hypothetical protein